MTTPRIRTVPPRGGGPTVLLALLLACSSGALLAQHAPGDSARRSDGLSLQPERTISFETAEGTYINLDVSPDGSTIVFEP